MSCVRIICPANDDILLKTRMAKRMMMMIISLLPLLLTLPSSINAQEKQEKVDNPQITTESIELPVNLSGEKLLAAQVNAIAVLNMIKMLEEEMEVCSTV